MSYQIAILRRAVKQLAQLPEKDRRHVQNDIRALADNPRPHGVKKLVGRNGYRIRCGNYRVIYEINDSTQFVTILDIGHRRDIYD